MTASIENQIKEYQTKILRCNNEISESKREIEFNEELIEEVHEYREQEKCSTEDAFTSVFSSYVIDS